MPQAAYPTSIDLQKYLEALSLFGDEEFDEALAFLDLNAALATAIAAWEMETGWHPFLGDAVDVARFYDPAGPNQFFAGGKGGGRHLFLDAGLLSVTSVTVDFGPDFAGDPLTAETEYWLRPYNAAVMGQPYTEIEMVPSIWGFGKSVKVVGKWGYSATIPDDGWNAILQRAALELYPEIAARITGGAEEFTEAGVTERYGKGFLLTQVDQWEKRWARRVMRYKRVIL